MTLKEFVVISILNIFQINFIGVSIGATALIMGLTDDLINSLYTHRSFSSFYQDIQQRAKLYFLFMESSSEMSTSLTCMVTLLTILQFIILIPSIVFVPYLDLFVLLVPLCCRRIMQEFQQFSKNTKGAPMASKKVS